MVSGAQQPGQDAAQGLDFLTAGDWLLAPPGSLPDSLHDYTAGLAARLRCRGERYESADEHPEKESYQKPHHPHLPVSRPLLAEV